MCTQRQVCQYDNMKFYAGRGKDTCTSANRSICILTVFQVNNNKTLADSEKGHILREIWGVKAKYLIAKDRLFNAPTLPGVSAASSLPLLTPTIHRHVSETSRPVPPFPHSSHRWDPHNSLQPSASWPFSCPITPQ